MIPLYIGLSCIVMGCICWALEKPQDEGDEIGLDTLG